MNTALKNALKEEVALLKIKSHKKLVQIKSLLTAFIGWFLMIVATPYLAMNVPSEAPSFFTSLFICGIFLTGATFIKTGLDRLEETNKEKTASELLNGLELGSQEEYRAMLQKTGRSH
jgi:hypothetical protein